MPGDQFFCGQCGKANTPVNGQPPTFCTNCGVSLGPSGPAPQRTGTPTAAIATIAALAVALVCVLVYFLVLKKDPGATPSADATTAPESGPTQEEELANDCISNVKQASLAMLMYSGDYDDMYPAVYNQDAIMPYAKNAEIFICPKTDEKYSFNTGLQNINMTAIMMPAMVVLFYEGAAQSVSKPHEGKGMVSFTDGHAKAVEDESKLFWRYDQETP